MTHTHKRSVRHIAGPLLLLAAAPLLSGCVAALIPIAAIGAFGGKQLLGSDLDDRSNRRVASAVPAAEGGASDDQILLDATAAAIEGYDTSQFEILDGGALPAPSARDLGIAISVPPALPDDALDSDSFLPGFLKAQGERQRAGMGGESVVLMPDTDPFAPQVTICEDLPYAFLVQLGGAPAASVETGAPDRLVQWVRDARQAGLNVVFSVSEAAQDSAATERALVAAGLGPADHGSTLWIVGDKGSTDSEALRWKIASHYCIVAMTADQPDDFTFLYGSYPVDAMRRSMIASLWNAGWFLSPDPLALPLTSPQSGDQRADGTSTVDNGAKP